MGKLITFWSPYPGRSKTTSVMCAMAGAFGISYPNKDLAVSHVVPDSTELEERLDCRIGGREKRGLYDSSGLTALEVQYMQSVLTSEKIRRCAIPLLMKSLYLFPGSGNKRTMEELRYTLLAERLVQNFSYLFLDLGSGKTETALRFMEAADAVVVVLPPQPEEREKLKAVRELIPKEKEVGIIFGGCLSSSRYSPERLMRRKEYADLGKIIGGVPVNAGYMDAMAEGRTLDFFLRNEMVKKKEDNYEFIYQTKRTAEQLKMLADREKQHLFLFRTAGADAADAE